MGNLKDNKRLEFLIKDKIKTGVVILRTIRDWNFTPTRIQFNRLFSHRQQFKDCHHFILFFWETKKLGKNQGLLFLNIDEDLGDDSYYKE